MSNRKDNGQFEKGTHWRTQKPWWNYEWLQEQYVTLERSASEIADEGNVTSNAILYWLRKHGIKGRSTSEARAIKHWGLCGEANPMWNRRGELSPVWRGGVTAERQAFYTTREWKSAKSVVWERDKGVCRRCGKTSRGSSSGTSLHVHHIESFENVDLRSDVDNLVLLCAACHGFVHSKKNVKREYLPRK